jgi:Domain of unknown function (DUF4258)
MSNKLIFRKHALQRMFQRSIRVEDVRTVLSGGRSIIDYPDDTPYPSRLMLGWCGERPIHVVAADTPESETIIITVYEPDPALWEPGFERKKS